MGLLVVSSPPRPEASSLPSLPVCRSVFSGVTGGKPIRSSRSASPCWFDTASRSRSSLSSMIWSFVAAGVPCAVPSAAPSDVVASRTKGTASSGMVHPPRDVRVSPGKQFGTKLTSLVTRNLPRGEFSTGRKHR